MGNNVAESNFATNLRRLLLFEHRTAKEAAASLGVTEATVSRWLTGKRYPSAELLIALDKHYGVSPRELDSNPVEFAQKLADPDRIAYADAVRAAARTTDIGKDPRIAELAEEVGRRRRQKPAENVVPIRRKR